MVKRTQIFWGIFLLSLLSGVSNVAAKENWQQQADAEVITAHQIDFLPFPYQMGRIGTESCDYVFTNISAGKTIPLRVETDGVMWYCFSSDKIELLDENKRVICGKTDSNQLMGAFPSGQGSSYEGKTEPVYLLPVRKEKTYYVRFPAAFSGKKYGVFAYVFPQKVKELKCGTRIRKRGYIGDIVCLSEGNGKYIYYSFTVKKKSMASVFVDPMFLDGGDSAYFKVQKKVKGKWKNIASVRKKNARYAQIGFGSLYGFSTGKYRLGVKAKKGQISSISLDICSVKYKSPTKKSKAYLVKKGKKKEGIFVWEDAGAHWYKVIKSPKNRVKKIEMHVSTVGDKVNFTIYRKGSSIPLKKVSKCGHDRAYSRLPAIKYISKSYTLKDYGTYYIKVSKANKKTNGAYKLSVE